VILNQVTNGVAVRMAVLYLLSAENPSWRGRKARRGASMTSMLCVAVECRPVAVARRGADVLIVDGKIEAVGGRVANEGRQSTWTRDDRVLRLVVSPGS